MEWNFFNNTVRDRFDNVFAIHWKNSSIEHIIDVINFFKNTSTLINVSSLTISDNFSKEYLQRYFNRKEEDWASFELNIDDTHFQCFFEFKNSLSIWFNDGGDNSLSEFKFDNIKKLMKILAKTFKRTMYFVNEGESEYRYKLFHIEPDGNIYNYDIENYSKITEKVEY